MVAGFDSIDKLRRVLKEESKTDREKGRRGMDVMARSEEDFLNKDFLFQTEQGAVHIKIVKKVD